MKEKQKMDEMNIIIDLPGGNSERIDRYIARKGILTRGQIKARDLHVYKEKGGSEIKLSLKVKSGDSFYLEWQEEMEFNLEPEKIDLNILFENDSAVVINKQAGLVVHPAIGNWTGTLVQGLLYHNQEMAREFDTEEGRPGIVHRLDKDTTGVIITAKNRASLEFLSSQFRKRETEKTYLCLVKGAPLRSLGTIEGYLARDKKDRKKFALTQEEGGKWSQSDYKVKERFKSYTLLEVRIFTGRTHQIRVHFKSINNPILGDEMYGRRDNRFPHAPLMLHSWKLGIRLSEGEDLTYFEAPLPQEFENLLEQLRKEDQF